MEMLLCNMSNSKHDKRSNKNINTVMYFLHHEDDTHDGGHDGKV